MRQRFHRNLLATVRLAGLLAAMITSVPSAGLGQNLEELASGAAKDLQTAFADLSKVRQDIEVERLPLAKHITVLEQAVAERRVEFAKAQRAQENQLVELNALKAEARQRVEEVKYIESLLSEYTRAFRSRLNFVEEPRYNALIESVNKAAAAADLAPAERFSARSILLTSALKRAEGAQGGEIIEGRALDKTGVLRAGKVALVGPVAMFSASSGGPAGLLEQELNKADPTIAKLDLALEAASRALVASGSGELVLDPTLGNAFKLAGMKESLFEKLKKGGIVMIPLVGLGVAAVLLALFKWIEFSRVRLATESDLQAVLKHLGSHDRGKAMQHVRSIPGMAGDLLAAAVEHVDEKKEYIEEVLYEKMLGARMRLERGLPFLALAATTGPLMGLLGTVTGMIATFKIISSFGGGDPKMLAAGISEALICTATGMGVAIPALLFHAFLSRRAKSIIGSMEQTAVGFVNGVPDAREEGFDLAASCNLQNYERADT